VTRHNVDGLIDTCIDTLMWVTTDQRKHKGTIMRIEKYHMNLILNSYSEKKQLKRSRKGK